LSFGNFENGLIHELKKLHPPFSLADFGMDDACATTNALNKFAVP
jgi:hypothetical protein